MSECCNDPDRYELQVPERKWFAAYTASHHEKNVQRQLTERDVESFVPLYSTTRRWNKRKPVELVLPLFPNYVFVRISAKERTAVLGTPGVFSLVGSSQQAWALPEKEIQALRNGDSLHKMAPHPYLTVGDRAKVRTGLLAGLEGMIVRTKSSFRFVLNLDQIMRSVAIEVEAEDLEPVSETRILVN